MRITVLGATGYVGGRLVPELAAAGHEVTCLARTPARLDDRPWRADVRVVPGDVLEPDTLVPAFAGADAVFHLVHAMGHSPDFVAADRRAALNVRDAAAEAGVGHIVYLGGLGDEADPDLSPHLRSRHEVGRLLGSGPVPCTELRAAVVIGSGSASFEMLRSLVEVLPVMVVPRWVTDTRCQPVAIADVLVYLAGVLDHRPDGHRVLDVGGSDVLTYRQMMDAYAEEAGLPRRLVLPVPVLSPGLSSHWVNLVTPLPIGLARPLIDSQVNDVLVRPDHDVRTVVDHRPMSFREAIGRAIHRVQHLAVGTAWFDSEPGRLAEPYPGDPAWAGGTLLVDHQTVETTAPPAALFAEVTALGGQRGWLVANWLWWLRGLADKLVGGVGMRRGRRHPTELRVGDAVDFWRVEAVESPGLLRLRAEMKLPGRAWLEWTITGLGGGRSRLDQRALFAPKGLTGRLYWYALVPFHDVIFRRLALRLAEAAGRRTPGPADATGPAGTIGRAPAAPPALASTGADGVQRP